MLPRTSGGVTISSPIQSRKKQTNKQSHTHIIFLPTHTIPLTPNFLPTPPTPPKKKQKKKTNLD